MAVLKRHAWLDVEAESNHGLCNEWSPHCSHYEQRASVSAFMMKVLNIDLIASKSEDMLYKNTSLFVDHRSRVGIPPDRATIPSFNSL
jgi:hypothetical protein